MTRRGNGRSGAAGLVALAIVAVACARERTAAPPPAAPGPGPALTPAPSTSRAPSVAPTHSGTDAWAATCAAASSCGVCMNRPPCTWCAGDERCVSPDGACTSKRLADGAACMTAPLALEQERHPELASGLRPYQLVRESKTLSAASFRQERFFINDGDCFAILTESSAPLRLHYAIAERGTPDPTSKKPPPEPGTGKAGKDAELSPEFCPYEPVYLVVTSLSPSASAVGEVRLHLLRRPHPDPARLERERPPRPTGGNCSSYECGEDCTSELNACNLDCFRYGRHEMGSESLCKAGCNQAHRSCERSCRIPCPR